MLTVSCDGCGKQMRPGDDHHIVKIEVFAARDPGKLTEADLDEDHLQSISELLQRLENSENNPDLEPTCCRRRYDLCGECRKRYLRDPLGRESASKVLFSKN
jgi:hypothetical protein